MGITPVKKTPSKTGRSPAHERRSQSKALKEDGSPASLLERTPLHERVSSFSHNLPTDEQKRGNGRVVGRNLIMWGRPRMAEKLLLHLHYECTRHRVVLPWDAIAHRLHPGSSGAAVVQHLNRVRKELIREGHLVPPVCQKPSANSNLDPTIRGYVRKDPDGVNKDATRPVRFDEKYDDLRFNLPDSFENSGDEDCSIPGSPNPMSIPQSTTTDESISNSQHRLEQSWSPQSSFCSPSRKQREEVEKLENPLLTKSFDTVTSVASAAASAATSAATSVSTFALGAPAQWQEAPWPHYSPMAVYPYTKSQSALHSPFSGYLTFPANYSMFPTDEPFRMNQPEHGMQVDCSAFYDARQDASPAMSFDEGATGEDELIDDHERTTSSEGL